MMAGIPGVPIADYGLLGDTRTAALVSSAGSVDWLCAPSFDGLPVFGALVGGEQAGSFAVGPEAPVPPAARRYQSDRSIRTPSSRSSTDRTRRSSSDVRGGGVAVTITRGASDDPSCRTTSSMGRPVITITRR